MKKFIWEYEQDVLNGDGIGIFCTDVFFVLYDSLIWVDLDGQMFS